jgi:hypothetical protein
VGFLQHWRRRCWSEFRANCLEVPHLRRCPGGPHGTPGQAGQAGSSFIDAPALPGWADVWRAGPPGEGSGWIPFCGSLTQELIKLWHCQRPVRKCSKRANLDTSELQPSLRDLRQAGAGWSRYFHGWSLFSKRCPKQPIEKASLDKSELLIEVFLLCLQRLNLS